MQTGRLFVVGVTVVAYAIALLVPQSIFDLATQYAFAGYSALSPLLVAALFSGGFENPSAWFAMGVLIAFGSGRRISDETDPGEGRQERSERSVRTP